MIGLYYHGEKKTMTISVFIPERNGRKTDADRWTDLLSISRARRVSVLSITRDKNLG